MASTASFDSYGFFNSIQVLNQTNWASYFGPVIADGVLAEIDNEMECYGNSSGMYVYVKTGECRVRSHRGVLSSEAALDIAEADVTYDRIDLIVARVTYGNPSTMVVAVKTGTPASSPVVPSVTQTAGTVWEIPLAEVTVPANAVTIRAVDVTDRRFVYKIDDDTVTTFSATSLTLKNDREYRDSGELASLTLYMPANPNTTFMCSVCFGSSAAFTGVVCYVAGTSTTITPKVAGDALTLVSKRYTLIVWWDGTDWWIASKAA